MQMYEFSSVIEDKGVIHIPNTESQNNKKKHFSAIKLKTRGFKFDRDAANER
jgi:hypothetical protein